MSIQGSQFTKGQVNIKIINGDKEVSLALDDSCQGALPTTFIRSSLCVFEGEKKERNITNEIFGENEVYHVDGEDLVKALNAIGFDSELNQAQMKIAYLEARLEEMADEFMFTCSGGSYAYAENPKLAKRVNEALGLK